MVIKLENTAQTERKINKQIERRKLILSGNLWKTIIIICFPIMFYQFINSLSTVIDQMITAGISASASNAVGSTGQIKNMFSAFGGGLASGGAVLVARYYGAGKVHDARNASGNLFTLAIILNIVILLIFLPLARQVMQICQVADSAIDIGLNYFRLQLVELIFVTINSIFIGLEKAKGNSKLILYLNLGILTIKIGLTALFVYVFKIKDITWIELATIISQLVLTTIGLVLLFKKTNILRITVADFKLKSIYVKDIFLLSIPMFFGKFVMNLGKVSVNALAGYYYNESTQELIVGALGISNNISGLVTGMTSTFEESESSIVSQNLGNRNIRRPLKTFVRILLVSIIISAIGYILTRFVLIDSLVALFNNDKELGTYYSEMIKNIYVYDSLSIPALGLCSAVLGLLYGFGKTFLASILNFSRIGVRILTIIIFHYAFPSMSGESVVGIAMGISNGTIMLLAIIFFVVFMVSLKGHGYRGMHLSDPEPEVSKLDLGD